MGSLMYSLYDPVVKKPSRCVLLYLKNCSLFAYYQLDSKIIHFYKS